MLRFTGHQSLSPARTGELEKARICLGWLKRDVQVPETAQLMPTELVESKPRV